MNPFDQIPLLVVSVIGIVLQALIIEAGFHHGWRRGEDGHKVQVDGRIGKSHGAKTSRWQLKAISLTSLRLLPLVAAVCAVTIGCAPGPRGDRLSSAQAVVVSGVVIRNELPYTVTDVMIEIPATGGFAGCGNIPPRSDCSNTFEGRDYRVSAMLIRWTEHGQPHRTDPFILEVPSNASPGDAFQVEVIVFAPGQAGARLVDAEAESVRSR
jgi:hypothetical protein